jgi:hypothetical protein
MSQNVPPPILTVTEELLHWTLDRTASFPKSQRFTLGQRLDNFMLDLQDHIITARFEPRARPQELKALNLKLEKIRSLWRIVHQKEWISSQQLLFSARKLDEIGRMAGAWLKATEKKHP